MRRCFIAKYNKLKGDKGKKSAQGGLSNWLKDFLNAVGLYWRYIVYGLVAVVLIVVLGLAFFGYQSNRALKRQTEYYELSTLKDDASKVKKFEDFTEKYRGSEVSTLADMWLGTYYAKNGDKEKAVSFYERVSKVFNGDPVYFVAVDALVPLYADLGQFDKAISLLDDAIMFRSNPRIYEDRLLKGEMLEMAGKVEESEEIYKTLIDSDKTPADVKIKAEERIIWIATFKSVKESETGAN